MLLPYLRPSKKFSSQRLTLFPTDIIPRPSCSTEGRHPGDVRLAEQGAAPAGVARNHALGRLRATSRAALGPLCEVLAGRAGANAGSRKPGPELRRGESFARNAAVERREARRPASLAGGPWRSRDRPDRKAGHEVRRSAPALVGALPPLACARITRRKAYPAPYKKYGQRSVATSSLPFMGRVASEASRVGKYRNRCLS